MNEAHYGELGAQATDSFMEMIGAGPDYVSAGKSYFTVESHLRFLQELTAGDRISVTTQVLAGTGKKMHLFHRIRHGDTIAATVETVLLHVDLATRRTCLPYEEVSTALAAFAGRHAALPKPAAR